MTSSLTAFVVALVLTPVVRATARRFGWTRSPNARDSHQVPTPRGGGIAILVGMVVAVLIMGVLQDFGLAATGALALLMALVGLLDDAMDLSPKSKLLLQFAAATTLVFVVAAPFASLALAAVSIVWIVGVTNAFNFMDGVNGIAALEAVICGVVMGLLLARAGDTQGAILCFAAAGGAAGFFPWNAWTGSIFMGDVGSLPLGFVFGAVVVRGAIEGIAPWVMVLPLLPFMLDTGVTLARRLGRGEKILHAHRTHYYQRLTDLGWSHAAVTLLWGGLAAMGGTVALFWETLGTARAAAVAGVVVLHAMTFAVIALFHERRRRDAPGAR